MYFERLKLKIVKYFRLFQDIRRYGNVRTARPVQVAGLCKYVSVPQHVRLQVYHGAAIW